MPEFHTSPASAQSFDDTSFAFSKCPREQLLLLHVEAAHCPNVIGRILHFVTASADIPVDVTFENGSKRLTVDIFLDRAAIDPTVWFLEQVEGIPAVKSAEFLDHDGRIFVAATDVDGGDRMAGGMGAKGGHAPIQMEAQRCGEEGNVRT